MRDELAEAEQTLDEALERQLDDLPSSLRSVVRDATPERVYDPGRVVLSIGNAADGVADHPLPAATAVELLCVYGTLRSELLESTPGDLTVVAEERDRSLLAGDLVLAKVFSILGELTVESDVQERCYAVVERATAQIIESFAPGEPETANGTEPNGWMSPASKRTGAVFGAATALGGILAGNSNPQSLYRRGVAFGVRRSDNGTDVAGRTNDVWARDGAELRESIGNDEWDEFVARALTLSADDPTEDGQDRLQAFVEDVRADFGDGR